jgi:hypothetical protein
MEWSIWDATELAAFCISNVKLTVAYDPLSVVKEVSVGQFC